MRFVSVRGPGWVLAAWSHCGGCRPAFCCGGFHQLRTTGFIKATFADAAGPGRSLAGFLPRRPVGSCKASKPPRSRAAELDISDPNLQLARHAWPRSKDRSLWEAMPRVAADQQGQSGCQDASPARANDCDKDLMLCAGWRTPRCGGPPAEQRHRIDFASNSLPGDREQSLP